MNRTYTLVGAAFLATAFALSVGAGETPQAKAFKADAIASVPSGTLWRDRGNIGSLNLFDGPGGKEHRPGKTFTFVKEDPAGTSPKFDILDEHGVTWKAKLGEETKAETAATRLLWAAGYFVDEDYYLAEIRVEKMPRLRRGQQFVSGDGVLHGVRLERKVKGQKKTGNWSWYKNSQVGTKDLSGLRIMMALMNNWDLKEVNNAVYEHEGKEPRFVVSDLGATFGRTGNPFVRSKSNMRDYRGTRFIQKIGPEHVDFYLSSRPFFLTVFDLPNYLTRTRMQGVVKHIPRTHAQWLGH